MCFSEKNVIFDLDGTIIDSASSIINSLEFAFKSYSNITVTNEFIGPPLLVIIKKIIQQYELSVPPEEVIQIFKDHYDNEGYKVCCLYSNAFEVLKQIKSEGFGLFIATNKRLIPTLKILSHFEIALLFDGVYSVDSHINSFSDKSEVLSNLLSVENLDKSNCIYIGDRYEDYLAAQYNSIDFYFANWGYKDKQKTLYPNVIKSFNDLHESIMSWAIL